MSILLHGIIQANQHNSAPTRTPPAQIQQNRSLVQIPEYRYCSLITGPTFAFCNFTAILIGLIIKPVSSDRLKFACTCSLGVAYTKTLPSCPLSIALQRQYWSRYHGVQL